MSYELYRLSQEITSGKREKEREERRPFSSAAYGAVVMGAAATVLGVNTLSNSESNSTPHEEMNYEALVGVDPLNTEMLMPAGWQTEEESLYAPDDYKAVAAHEDNLMTLVTEDDSQILEIARGDTADGLRRSDYEVCIVTEVASERIGGQDMKRTDLACLGDYAVTLWTGEVNNQAVTVRHGRESSSDEAYTITSEESLTIGR